MADPLVLDRARTAALFLDFQHDVCAPGGRMVSQTDEVLARFAAAVGEAARVLAAARAAGVTVLHVRHAFAPGYPELSQLAEKTGMQRTVIERRAFVDGEEGAEIVAPLRPLAGEPVLRKTTISPFRSTDLGERLARSGLDTVVLCGVVTHYVVLTTGVEAQDRGLRVLVVRDACSSGDLVRHDTALAILRPLAHVVDGAEAVRALGA